jgi:hypothetical protein
MINTIYSGTVTSSPARRLIVDLYAEHSAASWFNEDEYNSEFLLDLKKELLTRKGKILQANCSTKTCAANRYHEENSGISIKAANTSGTSE